MLGQSSLPAAEAPTSVDVATAGLVSAPKERSEMAVRPDTVAAGSAGYEMDSIASNTYDDTYDDKSHSNSATDHLAKGGKDDELEDVDLDWKKDKEDAEDGDDEDASSTPDSPPARRGRLRDLSASEEGIAEGKIRRHFWQIWRPRKPPRKAPASLDTAKEIPLATASWLSVLTYQWVTVSSGG